MWIGAQETFFRDKSKNDQTLFYAGVLKIHAYTAECLSQHLIMVIETHCERLNRRFVIIVLAAEGVVLSS